MKMTLAIERFLYPQVPGVKRSPAGDDRAVVQPLDLCQQVRLRDTPEELVVEDQQRRPGQRRELGQLVRRCVDVTVVSLP